MANLIFSTFSNNKGLCVEQSHLNLSRSLVEKFLTDVQNQYSSFLEATPNQDLLSSKEMLKLQHLSVAGNMPICVDQSDASPSSLAAGTPEYLVFQTVICASGRSRMMLFHWSRTHFINLMGEEKSLRRTAPHPNRTSWPWARVEIIRVV